jgi:hypothetical protein
MSDEAIAKKAMKEEITATLQYDTHIAEATDPKLIKILKHNQHDEISDHAKHLGLYYLMKEAKKAQKRVRA